MDTYSEQREGCAIWCGLLNSAPGMARQETHKRLTPEPHNGADSEVSL